MKNKIFKSAITVITCSITVFVITLFNTIGSDKLEAYFSVFSFPEEFTENKPLSTMNFDMLNDTEKKAYISVFNNIKNHPEYIKIPLLSQSEFENFYFAVKNDNPDILCFSDSCNMITFMSSCFLQLNYEYEKDECEIKTDILDKKVDEILKSIDTSDAYTAELAIHDHIVMNCSYTEGAENASNAYGCLIGGEAVCSGYSRAAMLLLKKAGVESMLIGGTGITAKDESISHMWNIVWINEKPYHLDVTWDDPDFSENIVSHMFFNLTTEDISVDHKEFSVDIECNSTEAGYFLKEDLLFDKYDSETLTQIKNRLCENINSGKNYIEIEFSDSNEYNTAVESIIDNSTPSSDMYKIISYVSENTENKVDTSHINFVKENEKNYIRLMFDTV